MSDKKQKIILAQIETQEVPQTEFSQFEIVNAVEASSPGGLNKKKLIYIGEGKPVNDIYSAQHTLYHNLDKILNAFSGGMAELKFQ